MQAERFDGAAAFLAAAGDHLAQSEAANNLMVGVARRIADGRKVGQGEPLFAGVRDEGGVLVGAALWTPPWRIMLSLMPAPATAKLAEAIWGWGVRPRGAVGPIDTARAFCIRLSGEAKVVRTMRVFELRAVTSAPPTPGSMRVAGDTDRELVAEWYAQFNAEAKTDNIGDPRETGRIAVDEGRAFLWDDGGPASVAAVVRRLAGGAAIGNVYTPPDRRRHGYATALVAALSQKLLEEGAAFCCLFTDLANPTSNSIYPKVGYHEVCDFAEVDMAAAG